MKKEETENKKHSREGLTPEDGYYLDSDYDEDGDLEFSEESWEEDEEWDSPMEGKREQEGKRAWQEQEEARARAEEKAKAREEILRRATEAVARAEEAMRNPRAAEQEEKRNRALERAREEGKKRAEAARKNSELTRMKEDWAEPIHKAENEDWLDTIQREEEKAKARLVRREEKKEGTEPSRTEEADDWVQPIRKEEKQFWERQIRQKAAKENDEIEDEEGMDLDDGTDSDEEMDERAKKSTEVNKKEKSSGGKAGKIVGGTAAVLLLAGGAAYCVMAQQYKKEFFPNTRINGIDAGKKEVAQVEEMISSAMDGYQIRIVGRKGQEEVVTKEDVGLHTVFDGALEEILEAQNPYLWGIHLWKKEDLQINTVAAYDETAFQSKVESLSFLDPQNIQSGREAYLSEYIEGTGYEIVPEDPGTEIKKDTLMEALGQAMLTMQSDFVLEDAGCYLKPLPGDPDPALVEQRDMLNRFAQMTVTYTFGEEQEVLDGDLIHDWVSFDEANKPVVDEEQVKEFVADLAKKYDTANTVRKFTTSYGSEVEVSGSYGWKIDQSAETEALKQIIAEGESMVREPEYSQEGVSRSEKDYGDTYAEVNLTAQHLFLYKDGEKIMESDFVSGNVARGFSTPAGLYSIAYKQRNAVLRGPGYASPVNFWMPFNGGIGFHDASWRGSFGGSIYRTNGSHGCVNMPYNTAKIMFETVYAGMPVICYNLDGTSNTKSTNASGGTAPRVAAQPAVTAPAAPVVQPQVPAAAPVLGNEGGGSMGGGSVVVPGAVPETPAAADAPAVSGGSPDVPTAPVVPGGSSDGSFGGGSVAGGVPAGEPALPAVPAETPAPAAPAETPAPAAPAAPAVPEGAGVVVPDVPAVPGM